MQISSALEMGAKPNNLVVKIVKIKEDFMSYPTVVSREEWLAAREELLKEEKELTHAKDQLAATRRKLPMVKVEKEYVFEGPHGKVSLLDLFEGRNQLMLYHFMYGRDWEKGCIGCTNFVNEMCYLPNLHGNNTSVAVVSRAPLAKLEAWKEQMDWTIPWFSSSGSDFNVDFNVSNDEGEISSLSVFLRDGDTVYHTYQAFQRGVDILLNSY